MRDIKFRGKLINSKEWAEGNLHVNKQGTTIITPDETVLGRYGKVNPETLGQYTGLKDKNGKEIYEGDICNSAYVECKQETAQDITCINCIKQYFKELAERKSEE